MELGLEYGPPAMNIGGQTWKFEEGQWITGNNSDNAEGIPVQRSGMCCHSCWIIHCWSLSGQCKIDSCFVCVFVDPESGGNASSRELQRLKKKNVQLEEENNLLKLKIEVLLDMVYQVALIMPLQSQSH